MQVLFFTLVWIALFGFLSIQQLHRYQIQREITTAFVDIQREEGRAYWNATTQKKYERHVATPQEKTEKEREKGSDGCAKLPISLLIDRSRQEEKPTLFAQQTLLLRRFLERVYFSHPDFSREKESLDRLMSALLEVLAEKKLHSLGELGAIDLRSEPLNVLFTRLLKGSLQEGGPPPLIDALNIQLQKRRVRVYLASCLLLEVLYRTPSTAQKIVSTRKALYGKVQREEMTPARATFELKQLFAQEERREFSDLFDYRVTKTWPGSG